VGEVIWVLLAQKNAVCKELSSLLQVLQPRLKYNRVAVLDPAARTACKLRERKEGRKGEDEQQNGKNIISVLTKGSKHDYTRTYTNTQTRSRCVRKISCVTIR
jgi:hypothetical protein